MKAALVRFLGLFMIVLAALLADSFSLPASRTFLIGGVLIGTFPLLADIARTFLQKRIDLGLPVVVTIAALLLLGNAKSAAVFVLLILAGRFFKDYVLWRVRESIASISKSLPEVALRKRDGEIREIPISELRSGDVVAVKGGGRVPVDGILLSESAEFDESVITGEARAVRKTAGERVIAAAIILSDYAELQATDTSANSTLAQMQKLVADAQSRNAPLSRFTTRYAEITSLAALAGVAVFYLLTKNVERALALWIALVPVIFAVIVPVATTLGITLLAKVGILIKTAASLEDLTRIDTLCFDKTGTLTQGRPQLIKAWPLGDFSEETLIQIAASVERYSEHHLGESIVRRAKELQLPWLDVNQLQVLKGRGISSVHPNGKRILLGNRELMLENRVSFPSGALNEIQSQEETGATPVFVSLDGGPAGIIFLADRLRDESKPTLLRLRKMGFRLVMLTGDSASVAQKVAVEAGMTEVRAGLLPQDKIRTIRELKEAGGRILMVGDGINDAPALAEANVGVAMGLRGIGITLEAAQVVLVHDDLAVLPDLFRTSKATFRIIRSDLFLATAIHLATAGLVVSGAIGILGSTLIHQMSSALVLANTLRLFRISARRS